MQVDVLIIGGAYAGASAGLLLRRRNPAWRILIVEKSQEFDRKVGESTTEVSSRFMHSVLGIMKHLGHEQLNKQGLRMWFTPENQVSFEHCTEVGAKYNSRLSGYQVDRSVLDEYLLNLAVEAGCELRRPAKVVHLQLDGAGKNVVTIDGNGGALQTIQAGWIIDASGRAAVIARRLGLLKPLEEHPVNAIWGRFKGVRDWDSYEMRTQYPCYAKACHTGRQWATNHLMGRGWWTWIIPLKGGDTSIGLVYDSRLYTPPEGPNLAARLKTHFLGHPVGREMLSDAQAVEGDMRTYSQLPYSVSQVMGDGWILAGDASGFLDPFYSPGLDFCSYTAHHAHSVVGDALEGKPLEMAERNRRFAFCFRSWFETIYKDKYYYMGDAELMSAAFLLDIASYHLGPVREVLGCNSRFSEFPFGGVPGKIAAKLMSFYNRRLAMIARKKMAAGTFGDLNADWRLLIGGYLPDFTAARLMLKGALRWLKAEARASRLAPAPEEEKAPKSKEQNGAKVMPGADPTEREPSALANNATP